MENNRKNSENKPHRKDDATHLSLLAVIGGYLVYMAYQMVRDSKSGASSMPMGTTILLALIMALCGLGVIGYCFFLWRKSRTEEEER